MLYEVITPNIVAGRKFLPELIQDECTPDTMAREIGDLLTDDRRREELGETCRALRGILAGTGPSEAVVEIVITSYSIHYTKLYEITKNSSATRHSRQPRTRSKIVWQKES